MSLTTTRPAPVLPPLQIGRHTIGSPVVLAPMAGITNRAFRRLCREYGDEGLAAGGASGATSLYVSEMITSRALVERTPISMKLIEHDPEESPRSILGIRPRSTPATAARCELLTPARSLRALMRWPRSTASTLVNARGGSGSGTGPPLRDGQTQQQRCGLARKAADCPPVHS